MKKSKQAWRPNARQAEFLRLQDVYEVLFGGQVAGGKTDALIMAPMVYPEYRTSPHFKGLILRHDGQSLDKEIIPRTQRGDMYAAYAPGAKFNSNRRVWTLPSQARIIFTHAKDLLAHHGAEYQYVGWDELTHFTEEQYCWILTRLRSAVNLPIRVRAGTNPLGPGSDWVKRRWGPWLSCNYLFPDPFAEPAHRKSAESLRAILQPREDESGRRLPPALSGQILWYSYDDEGDEI